MHATHSCTAQCMRLPPADLVLQPGLSKSMLGRTPRGIRQQQLEDLIDSGVASTEITGRVGDDCCDDEVYPQVCESALCRDSASSSRGQRNVARSKAELVSGLVNDWQHSPLPLQPL